MGEIDKLRKEVIELRNAVGTLSAWLIPVIGKSAFEDLHRILPKIEPPTQQGEL